MCVWECPLTSLHNQNGLRFTYVFMDFRAVVCVGVSAGLSSRWRVPQVWGPLAALDGGMGKYM
jgi:hypothetical protein